MTQAKKVDKADKNQANSCKRSPTLFIPYLLFIPLTLCAAVVYVAFLVVSTKEIALHLPVMKFLLLILAMPVMLGAIIFFGIAYANIYSTVKLDSSSLGFSGRKYANRIYKILCTIFIFYNCMCLYFFLFYYCKREDVSLFSFPIDVLNFFFNRFSG
ncbi:hypothetical protein [Desulforhopalus singaporensis]|uniref:Transmembrane protein n=1 Tax=Desulforhopalus singaporensis TaxID=91360 RepID=A0A1H0W4Q0_9BACT|nr:hypothetical protein [Desulforhopalus singaporensis]SDP85704.1 hypothetical protein SAMN05660330_04415 [Desulforhopalus singaporensis]